MEKQRTIDDEILEAVLNALASPSQYVLDNESITSRSPEELASLISMARKLKAEASPTASRSPFRVSVQNCNSTYSE